MGRKRKSRAPVKITNSPKQAKRDSDGKQEDPAVLIIDDDDSSDPLAAGQQEQQPLPSPPRAGASEKPWAEKCRQWIIEQQQQEAVEMSEPDVDEDVEEEPLMEGEHQEPLQEDQSQRTETTLRQKLKEYSEKQILNSVLYECEWMKCGFETIEDIVYLSHVEKHLYSYLAGQRDVTEYACNWDLCDFTTTVAGDLESHVHFHAYHNRIKTYGASLSNIISIPKCNSDSRRRNCIENFRTSFRCDWGDCEEVYRKAQPFFTHVNNHVQDQFPVDKKSTKQDLQCQWTGCKQQYKRCSIALEHVRKHSTERTIGCYNCGAIFVSRLKYIDHCKRQVEYHNREYPCSECDKLFATKQLMTDHKNIHNKRFACTLCPMMWPSRKALSYHIRYRHVEEKPFQCDICNHRSVTYRDLMTHERRHQKHVMIPCREVGCTTKFRNEANMRKHILHDHLGYPPDVYSCHLCREEFLLGAKLSNHLMQIHHCKRKPGCMRFKYRQDELDGKFRLAAFLDNELGEEHYNGEQVVPGSPSAQVAPETPSVNLKPSSPSEQVAPSSPIIQVPPSSPSEQSFEYRSVEENIYQNTWTSYMIHSWKHVGPNHIGIKMSPDQIHLKEIEQPKPARSCQPYQVRLKEKRSPDQVHPKEIERPKPLRTYPPNQIHRKEKKSQNQVQLMEIERPKPLRTYPPHKRFVAKQHELNVKTAATSNAIVHSTKTVVVTSKVLKPSMLEQIKIVETSTQQQKAMTETSKLAQIAKMEISNLEQIANAERSKLRQIASMQTSKLEQIAKVETSKQEQIAKAESSKLEQIAMMADLNQLHRYLEFDKQLSITVQQTDAAGNVLRDETFATIQYRFNEEVIKGF